MHKCGSRVLNFNNPSHFFILVLKFQKKNEKRIHSKHVFLFCNQLLSLAQKTYEHNSPLQPFSKDWDLIFYPTPMLFVLLLSVRYGIPNIKSQLKFEKHFIPILSCLSVFARRLLNGRRKKK